MKHINTFHLIKVSYLELQEVLIFSSPEPKPQDELLWSLAVPHPSSVRLSVCLSVSSYL